LRQCDNNNNNNNTNTNNNNNNNNKSLHVDVDMATDGSMHPQSTKWMYAGRFVDMITAIVGLALCAHHVS